MDRDAQPRCMEGRCQAGPQLALGRAVHTHSATVPHSRCEESGEVIQGGEPRGESVAGAAGSVGRSAVLAHLARLAARTEPARIPHHVPRILRAASSVSQLSNSQSNERLPVE